MSFRPWGHGLASTALMVLASIDREGGLRRLRGRPRVGVQDVAGVPVGVYDVRVLAVRDHGPARFVDHQYPVSPPGTAQLGERAGQVQPVAHVRQPFLLVEGGQVVRA